MDDVQLQTDVEPGEQGIATQDEEQAAPKVFRRDATEGQVEIADSIWSDLQDNAHQMSTELIVDRLVQCVDVLPILTVRGWQHDAKERYAESPVLERIGKIMLRGCQKLELSPRDVVFYWRNSKTWTKRGVTVLADAKVIPAWARKATDGTKVMVFANHREFRKMNTLQKLKALYHALRGLDADAKRVPPHFEGWVDELEHFGPKTFEQEVRMVNAITRGQEKELPFQLSLLDEPDEGDEAHAEAA